jgi:chlorobactene glucosyltransferase
VLDDQSTDDTADIVRSIGQGTPRLRLIKGQPLPAGWLGKNWACQQLAAAAQGEWLIFTDADVTWTPQALSALAAEMNQTQADLLTVWPTQHSQTWAERLTVPLMALVVLGYLPLPLVHHTPWPAFAAANGQCLAFRREAYAAIGGHVPVQNEVLEDVLLSRQIKANGLRLRMADGAGLINCRMYQDWSAVRDGFAKNILAGYGGRVSLLLLATVFHWLLFLLPWLWLAVGWVWTGLPGWPVWPLALVGLGVGLRALTAAATQQRLLDALLMPVSVLLMTRIAWQAIWWQWRYGGPLWKGRLITPTQASV